MPFKARDDAHEAREQALNVVAAHRVHLAQRVRETNRLRTRAEQSLQNRLQAQRDDAHEAREQARNAVAAHKVHLAKSVRETDRLRTAAAQRLVRRLADCSARQGNPPPLEQQLAQACEEASRVLQDQLTQARQVGEDLARQLGNCNERTAKYADLEAEAQRCSRRVADLGNALVVADAARRAEHANFVAARQEAQAANGN